MYYLERMQDRIIRKLNICLKAHVCWTGSIQIFVMLCVRVCVCVIVIIHMYITISMCCNVCLICFFFLFLFYSMCAVDALNRYGFCTAPLASMHWWCIRTIRTDWGFCLLALCFEGNIQQHSIDSYFSCGRFVHMHLANDIWRDWGIHQNKQTRKKKANFIFRKPINFSFHWSTTHTSTISSSIFAFFFFFGSRSQQVRNRIFLRNERL